MAIIKKWGLIYNDKCQIGEHTVSLPPLCKNRNDVLFIDDDYDHAFWHRLQFPDIFYGYVPYDSTKIKATVRYEEGYSSKTQATIWNKRTNTLDSLSKEDTELIDELAEKEVQRMTEGVFFRNGNDIEWIHPYHYTMLQWCKMKGVKQNNGYGFFYKFQRDVFYLIMHAIWLKWCKFVMFSKAKKTGFTQQIGGGYCVGAAITNSEFVIGMMSTSEAVAAGTGYDSFLHAFKGLPMVLKPMVAFMATKGGEMTLGDRSNNIVKKDDDTFLNTRIRCVPTKAHAFDSYPYNIAWFDEFLKLYTDAKQQPKIILNDNISGIEDQSIIRGIGILSSYPPERNDLGSEQGRKIFYDSKLSTIKDPEQGTTSGGICYHIPGLESMREFQDKYGNPEIEKANAFIQKRLKNAEGDPIEYMKIMRLYSPDEKSAFDTPASGSGLPMLRLLELSYSLGEQEKIDPSMLYIEGKFEWENEIWNIIPGSRRPGQFCSVKFTPLTDEERAAGKEGKVKLFHNNLAFIPNECLQMGYDEWGNLLPLPVFERVGGADPTQWAVTPEEGSKNAYYTLNMPDELIDSNARDIVTKVLLSEYYYRGETPDESFEDLVKEIIYFGKAVAVEGNAPAFFNELMKEKLGYYMFVRDKDGLIQLWTRDMGMYNEPDKKYASLKTKASADSKETLEEFIKLIARYVIKPPMGGKDYGAKIKTLKLINQCINLNVENTKKSDLFMAFGYTLMAMNAYLDIRVQGNKNDYEEALPQLLAMLGRRSL